MHLSYSTEAEAKAIFKHGQKWPLFKDYGLQLVSKEELDKMIDNEDIANSSWSRIPKGFALIIDKAAIQYSTTYEKLKQGLCDFQDGWDAAKAQIAPMITVGSIYGRNEVNWNTGLKPSKKVRMRKVKA